MKIVMHLAIALICLFFITICLSCGGGGNDAAGPVTISWQPDGGGFLQYSTNDPALYSSNHYHSNNTIQTTMTSVETQVQRISGSAGTGFGIFFCYQDPNNSYGIIINTYGHYLIIKRAAGISSYYVSGSWTTTQPSPWPTSSNLVTGLGNTNTIRVDNAGGGNFDLYFNGTFEISYTDVTFTGGDSGYFADVSDSSREHFPTTPADLRFKQITPALSTATTVNKISWQNDGFGFTQFSTNDTNDCGYFYFHSISPQFIPLSSVEIQVKKMSGYSDNGYGIIFCYQDQNNFYGISTTVNRYYLIYKRVAGTYSYYQGGGVWSTTAPSWPLSSNLFAGFGTTNNIKVVNNGGGNFDLRFNGALETSFTDSTFTGGYNGYSLSIGSVSEESFPTPADVRAKLIAAD